MVLFQKRSTAVETYGCHYITFFFLFQNRNIWMIAKIACENFIKTIV